MSSCCDFIILAVNTGMISVNRRVSCRTFPPKTPYILMPYNFRQKSSCKQKVWYFKGWNIRFIVSWHLKSNVTKKLAFWQVNFLHQFRSSKEILDLWNPRQLYCQSHLLSSSVPCTCSNTSDRQKMTKILDTRENTCRANAFNNCKETQKFSQKKYYRSSRTSGTSCISLL